MHRTTKTVLAAMGALLLCGNALGQEVRIPRKGSSPGFLRPPAVDPRPDDWWADEPVPCPRRSARRSQDHATQSLVVGYLIGGLLGALITSSAGKTGDEHARGEPDRRDDDECRTSRRTDEED